MKKLVYVFGVLLATSMFSCVKGQQENPAVNPEDTTKREVVDSALEQVTGVAIDGAMNGISLLVGDDTVYFDYPDLESDHKASWDINDTVTVRYYVTQSGDSVTDVINDTEA